MVGGVSLCVSMFVLLFTYMPLGCNATVQTYDDPTVSFDDLLIAYDGTERPNQALGLDVTLGGDEAFGSDFSLSQIELGTNIQNPYEDNEQCQ